MPESKTEIKGFFLHFSQCDALFNLPPGSVVNALKLCRDYCEGKETKCDDPIAVCAFGLMRPALDVSIKRAETGRKGGKANGKQIEANESKLKQNEANLKQTEAKEQRTNKKEQNINTPLISPQGGNGDISHRSRSQVTKAESQAQIEGYTESLELREALTAFVESRKALRKPLTAHGLTLALRELDRLAADEVNKTAIVNTSILKGWSGFFPLKEDARAAPESTHKSWAELEEERSRAEFLRMTGGANG